MAEIENRPGGRVTEWSKDGYHIIGRVIRPLAGEQAVFEGTLFQNRRTQGKSLWCDGFQFLAKGQDRRIPDNSLGPRTIVKRNAGFMGHDPVDDNWPC